MKRIFKWLTNIFLGLLVVMSAFILFPAIFSSRLAVVYSGSMEPAMPTGAIAVMIPVDTATIKVGDIIAFNPIWDDSEATVSHRVIEIVKEPTLSFVTKGDANEDPDPEAAPAETVLARILFNIPRLGYILGYTQRYTGGRLGFGFFIALPTVLLISSAIRDMNFMMNPRFRRARRRKMILEERKKRMSRW